MKSALLSALVALLVAGCGEIKHSLRLVQKLDEQLVAGVGDTIIEIDTRESLPNIAGKADMFGRTRPTGKIIVAYMGMERGRATFERYTIRMESNATTMNSRPVVIPQSSTTTYTGTTNVYGMGPSGTFSGTALSSGTAVHNAPPMVLAPSGSHTQVISNNRIRHYVDLSESRKLIVGGYEVTVQEATTSSIAYRVRKID